MYKQIYFWPMKVTLFCQYTFTIVSRKIAHGRSTLEVCQRGRWALFRSKSGVVEAQVKCGNSSFGSLMAVACAIALEAVLLKVHSKIIPGWALIQVNVDLIQEIEPKVGGGCSFV